MEKLELKKSCKRFNKQYYDLMLEDKIIGKAWTITKYRSYRDGLYLEIFENMRNKGYGTQFYELLLREVAGKCIEIVWMWIKRENKIAINFMNKNVDPYSDKLQWGNCIVFEENLIVE